MKQISVAVAFLLATAALPAQRAIPTGTLLPIRLGTTVDAAKAHPGQSVRATIMQDIPGTLIARNARVSGHIVHASAQSNGAAQIQIVFDTVDIQGRAIPIKSSLRALASFMEVGAAEAPDEGGDQAIPPSDSTYTQIGGEVVLRGGGPVWDGKRAVGQPTPYGVLAIPRDNPAGGCRGVVAENTQPQALWLFSTNACGLYGFRHLRIVHSGRTDPAGRIILASDKGKMVLHAGSGMLLRVLGP